MNLSIYLTNVQNLCKVFFNTFNISRDTFFILENDKIKIYTVSSNKDLVIEVFLDSIIIDNIISLSNNEIDIYSMSSYQLYNITKKMNYFGNCLFEFDDTKCDFSYQQNNKKTIFTIESKKPDSIYSTPSTTYSCIFTVIPNDFIVLINRCSVVDNDVELSIENNQLIAKSNDMNISYETKISTVIYKYRPFKFIYSKNYLNLIKHYQDKILYMKIYVDDFGLIKISFYVHHLGNIIFYLSPILP